MPTADRDEKEAREVVRALGAFGHWNSARAVTPIADALAKAFASGRASMNEECAEAVFVMTQQRSKADQIRALLTKETGT